MSNTSMPTASRGSPARLAHIPSIAAFALLGAAAAPLHAQSTRAAQPALSDSAIVASARGTIDSANTDWLAAVQRQDVASIIAPYADSAVFITASGASFTGRGAIARMLRDRFAQNGAASGGTIHQDGLAVQGSYIYEWGHAAVDYVRDGVTRHAPGRYVTVWARDPEGRWRIIRNLSLAP